MTGPAPNPATPVGYGAVPPSPPQYAGGFTPPPPPPNLPAAPTQVPGAQLPPQPIAPAGPALLVAFESCYLLTTDATGRVAIPGISLVADEHAVTVRKPDNTVAAVLPWDKMVSFTATARTETPDGQTAVVVEATTVVRSHRFVVPTTDPAAVEGAVAQVAAHAKGKRSGRRLSPALLAIVGVVAVVVTVLLVVSL